MTFQIIAAIFSVILKNINSFDCLLFSKRIKLNYYLKFEINTFKFIKSIKYFENMYEYIKLINLENHISNKILFLVFLKLRITFSFGSNICDDLKCILLKNADINS